MKVQSRTVYISKPFKSLPGGYVFRKADKRNLLADKVLQNTGWINSFGLMDFYRHKISERKYCKADSNTNIAMRFCSPWYLNLREGLCWCLDRVFNDIILCWWTEHCSHCSFPWLMMKPSGWLSSWQRQANGSSRPSPWPVAALLLVWGDKIMRVEIPRSREDWGTFIFTGVVKTGKFQEAII